MAGVVSLVAFIPYVVSIVRDSKSPPSKLTWLILGGDTERTKPSRATWIIFSVTAVITLASYSKAVDGNAIWVARGYVITTTLVALLSIKYGVWNPGRFDLWALVGCLATLALWAISGSAELALLAILATEGIGALSTIKKMLDRVNPEQENGLAWILAYTASVLTLLLVIVDEWSFLNAAYPAYLTVSSGVIAILSFQKKLVLPS